MKVELLKPIQGQSYFPGDVVEVEDDKARAWCESGHAILSKQEFDKYVETSDQFDDDDIDVQKIRTADSKKKFEKAVRK